MCLGSTLVLMVFPPLNLYFLREYPTANYLKEAIETWPLKFLMHKDLNNYDYHLTLTNYGKPSKF